MVLNNFNNRIIYRKHEQLYGLEEVKHMGALIWLFQAPTRTSLEKIRKVCITT